MLVLTFFSNSIMNYSLVEVSSEYIGSGKLTSRVRGSGTVETKEPYAVVLKTSRKIKTMEAKVDKEVSTGDVLFTLDEGDSSELREAKKALIAAESAYTTKILTKNITVEERKAAESGALGSLEERQKQLEDLKNKSDAANAYLDTMTLVNSNQSANSVDKYLDEAESERRKQSQSAELKPLEDKAAEAKNAETAASAALTEAQAELTAAKAENPVDPTKVTDCENKVNEAKIAHDNTVKAIASADKAVSDAKYNQSVSDYNYKMQTIQENIEAAEYSDELAITLNIAKKNADDAKKALDDAVATMTSQIELVSDYENILQLRKDVADLEEEVIEPEFKSPINGTVTEILYTAGQTPAKDETVLYIKPDSKAFTISFSTTQSNAGKIKVGDAAEVVNNWYGGTITAKVSKISKDRDNKANSVITCELEGDVKAGDNYTLSIGSSSSNYEYIVPTSSIREDSNGKFIYTIESKSTPLGNRYYARRCDIEVIAEDDTRTAVTGPSDEQGYVITTTSKPIEPNQQVRLAE